ncbi:MAG: TIGR01459 family HAD-type hydrolase [Pseudomonadota bacterium]
MTQMIDSLDAVAADYDALLVDLWGCYHNGVTPYPDALEALRRYRARAQAAGALGIVILLTNAPRPSTGVRRFLDAIGAPAEGDTHDGIMSSGEACKRAMNGGAHGGRYVYIGPERDLGMLPDFEGQRVSIEDADCVLLVGFRDDKHEDPSDYDAEMAAWAARGIPVLCANPDTIVDKGAERLWCAGAIAERYAERHPEAPLVWYGKPHAPSYDAAFALLDQLAGQAVARHRVLGIGDGIHTDVRGAHIQGCDALFISGGIAAPEVGATPEAPDPARLEAFFAAKGERPRYAMPFLR